MLKSTLSVKCVIKFNKHIWLRWRDGYTGNFISFVKNGHKGVRVSIASCEFKVCVRGIFLIKKKLRKVRKREISVRNLLSQSLGLKRYKNMSCWLRSEMVIVVFKLPREQERGGNKAFVRYQK